MSSNNGRAGPSFVFEYDSAERYRPVVPASMMWYPEGRRVMVRINKARASLPWGDYTLRGFSSLVAVERKGSIAEIHGNLFTDDHARHTRAFDRLAQHCKHPYLFLDMRWSDLYVDNSRGGCNGVPGRHVVDKLMQECHRRGITLLGPLAARTTTTRRQAIDFIIRVMLSHVHAAGRWKVATRRRGAPRLVTFSAAALAAPRRAGRIRAKRKSAKPP